MTYRARPVVLALAAAIVLFIALSKETWVAIPIVAAVAVLLLSRRNHLGRGTTAAAMALVASMAFVAFGAVIALLSVSARAMASLVLASGTTLILLGVIGLIVCVRHLRRVMQSAADAEPDGTRVSSP